MNSIMVFDEGNDKTTIRFVTHFSLKESDIDNAINIIKENI